MYMPLSSPSLFVYIVEIWLLLSNFLAFSWIFLSTFSITIVIVTRQRCISALLVEMQ